MQRDWRGSSRLAGGTLQEVGEEEGEAALLWEGAPPPIGVGGATRLETTSLGCRGWGGRVLSSCSCPLWASLRSQH